MLKSKKKSRFNSNARLVQGWSAGAENLPACALRVLGSPPHPLIACSSPAHQAARRGLPSASKCARGGLERGLPWRQCDCLQGCSNSSTRARTRARARARAHVHETHAAPPRRWHSPEGGSPRRPGPAARVGERAKRGRRRAQAGRGIGPLEGERGRESERMRERERERGGALSLSLGIGIGPPVACLLPWISAGCG